MDTWILEIFFFCMLPVNINLAVFEFFICCLTEEWLPPKHTHRFKNWCYEGNLIYMWFGSDSVAVAKELGLNTVL